MKGGNILLKYGQCTPDRAACLFLPERLLFTFYFSIFKLVLCGYRNVVQL